MAIGFDKDYIANEKGILCEEIINFFLLSNKESVSKFAN